MNTPPRAISGRRVIRALERAGFVVERVKGSHNILVDPNEPGRSVIVPVHAGRDLKFGTLRSIVRQAGMSYDEFLALL